MATTSRDHVVPPSGQEMAYSTGPSRRYAATVRPDRRPRSPMRTSAIEHGTKTLDGDYGRKPEWLELAGLGRKRNCGFWASSGKKQTLSLGRRWCAIRFSNNRRLQQRDERLVCARKSHGPDMTSLGSANLQLLADRPDQRGHACRDSEPSGRSRSQVRVGLQVRRRPSCLSAPYE
jgi:hypothetical protein